jgi:hypothetical protein
MNGNNIAQEPDRFRCSTPKYSGCVGCGTE